MTDRRIKDLSYGHLGKAIYDTEQGWIFSQDAALEQSVQILSSAKNHFPPCIQLEDGSIDHHAGKAGYRSLIRRYPELQVAGNFPRDFARASPDPNSSLEGSLLAVGRGLDPERLTGRSNSFPIFAMPAGDAAHLLRIVRPRLNRRAWDKHASVSLTLYAPEISDEGLYEIGCRSTIRQILFSNEDNESGTWVAVRQSTTITVLRIIYSAEDDLDLTRGSISIVKPTTLIPGSIATIFATGNDRPQVDVAFNPLYQRQLATVDDAGNWKIWDNEARHGKSRAPRLVASKSGNVMDNYDPDPNLRIPEYSFTDGWHRIIWVCNLSTILVCSRTHLAVFDLQSGLTRLDSSNFMLTKNFEIILDIKRSSKNLNHVFVLTTSRIYWVKIVSLEHGDGPEGSTGTHVLLSYRHYRNENDFSMRLTSLNDDYVSALIYSSKNSLINFYSFSVEGSEIASSYTQSAHGSFQLTDDGDDDVIGKSRKSIKALQWIPNSFETNIGTKQIAGLGADYLEKGVRFFQPLILTIDMGLSSTSCAFMSKSQASMRVKVPTLKGFKKSGLRGKRPVTDHSFIVQDGEPQSDDSNLPRVGPQSARNPYALLVNWTHVFESTFPEETSISASDNTTQQLAEVIRRIGDGLANNTFSIETLLEASSFGRLSEDLDLFGRALDDFLGSIPDDSGSLCDLVIDTTFRCPGINLPLNEKFQSGDSMKIYQELISIWIAGLPLETPPARRGSKFNVIRQITAELSLSLITISLRSKSSKIHALTSEEVNDEEDGFTTRASSPATFYSARASPGPSRPELNLLTPTYTPSAYSQLTSDSNLIEDPAISRLRQYAVSIRSRPDLGKPKILSEWPTITGVDPSTYVYKRATAESEMDDSEQESAARKKEAARRRKRTERFIQRNTANSSRAMTPAGSQPQEISGAPFSSQPTQDVPMTQPDRGTFGSRKVKGKGKKKQRTAGF